MSNLASLRLARTPSALNAARKIAHKAAPKDTRKFAIIGGRLEDDNADIYGQMHSLSGGRILIFPTASSEPQEVGEETLQAFRQHGFDARVVLMRASDGSSADDPAVAALVADYGSVYFTGGDQAKIYHALSPGGRETAVLSAIRKAHNRGGLLAGSSAGAAMMSQPMLLGGTSLEAMVHGVTQDPDAPGILLGDGLAFFTSALVDQHFIKRGRLGRLVVAMAATGHRRGFGVDENTALFVKDGVGRVVGEYGVFLVDLAKSQLSDANAFPKHSGFENFKLSYLDHGDSIDLHTYQAKPAATKRRVRKSEMAYRAPAHSRRNAFGAYALYDLMARLVLGDQSAYSEDDSEAFDPKTGTNVALRLRREKGRTRCLIAKPPSGLRMTGVNFRCSLVREELSATRIADREAHRVRRVGVKPTDTARIVLLGSSPIYSEPETRAQILDIVNAGPVGVFAAASADAKETAEAHVRLFRDHGVEAHDLGITIDTVDYAAKDASLLEKIRTLNTIYICGGNQIRLVETLLHRGEESAVLQAILEAHARGASIVAASGAVSAMPGVMIAGGSTFEALRYGVASDLGHQGLVIQEGVGLFGPGLADQNLISGRRLGRLVVACAEENEKYGIGVCEDSAAIATDGGRLLEARGRHGFVLVEMLEQNLNLHADGFIARNIKITMLGPGDQIDLHTGVVRRASNDDDRALTFS
ncbi:MAG: cyanophycinase, partial [Pseudomonadota bacterium]